MRRFARNPVCGTNFLNFGRCGTFPVGGIPRGPMDPSHIEDHTVNDRNCGRSRTPRWLSVLFVATICTACGAPGPSATSSGSHDANQQSGSPAVSGPTPPSVGSPSPAADDSFRAELRARPSLLASIDVSSGCPVTRSQTVQGTTVSALGSEPLFASGLKPTTLWEDATGAGGARAVEIQWVSQPDYQDPLLVRGVNLDSGDPLEFRPFGAESADELWLTSGTSTEPEDIGPGFRMWTAELIIPRRGCYALQVEGFGHFGGYTIVFELR